MSEIRGEPDAGSISLLIAVAMGLMALAVGVLVARPFSAASIAFDSQVAVLHAERIASGQHLEAYILTTPKPLLTAVFGTLYALTTDWRSLAWATIAAYAVAVAAATVLAYRLRGLIAALFSGVALILTPTLLFDVGFALATPWAAIGWFTAGLAVLARPRRYGLAGLALGLATLARIETLVLTGTIVVILIGIWLASHSTRFRSIRPPGRAWLVPAIGLSAILVMMAHDWRLTGEPLFWTTVAQRYTERTTLHIPTTIEVVRLIAQRYWGLGAIGLLAVIGVADLLRRREWAIATGLLGSGPGVVAFLVVLAARGIFVSDRYLAAVDASVAFASGIGAAAIASRLRLPAISIRRSAGRPEFARGVLAVGGVAAVAVLVAGPLWQVDPTLLTDVGRSRRLAADTDRAVAVIRPVLDAIPAAHAAVVAGSPTPQPIVLGPGPVWPRLVVSLDVAIPVVATTRASDVDVAAGYPAAGQIVFHSVAGDPPADGWSQLEVSRATTVGGVLLQPLLADPRRGLWVVRVGGTAP